MRDKHLLATGLCKMVWCVLGPGFWCVNLVQRSLQHSVISLPKTYRIPVANWFALVELKLFPMAVLDQVQINNKLKLTGL